jgi:hypothetical protein
MHRSKIYDDPQENRNGKSGKRLLKLKGKLNSSQGVHMMTLTMFSKTKVEHKPKTIAPNVVTTTVMLVEAALQTVLDILARCAYTYMAEVPGHQYTVKDKVAQTKLYSPILFAVF